MTTKLSTQKDLLNRVILTIKGIITNAQDVEKVTCTSENNNGRLVTRIEIISKGVTNA